MFKNVIFFFLPNLGNGDSQSRDFSLKKNIKNDSAVLISVSNYKGPVLFIAELRMFAKKGAL